MSFYSFVSASHSRRPISIVFIHSTNNTRYCVVSFRFPLLYLFIIDLIFMGCQHFRALHSLSRSVNRFFLCFCFWPKCIRMYFKVIAYSYLLVKLYKLIWKPTHSSYTFIHCIPSCISVPSLLVMSVPLSICVFFRVCVCVYWHFLGNLWQRHERNKHHTNNNQTVWHWPMLIESTSVRYAKDWHCYAGLRFN